MKKTIGIIFGGKTVEHDVSIITAMQIYQAIDKNKYFVEMFYLTKDNRILIGEKLDELETYKKQNFKKTQEICFYHHLGKTYYHQKNKKGKAIDCMINATHGKGAEDGTISGLLDIYNIPNTSSNLTESAIIQDKWITKLILKQNKIQTLPGKLISKKDKFKMDMHYPVIIKPVSLGSSIGIEIARSKDEFVKAINQSFKFQERLIIEPLLENFKEFSCAIYEVNQNRILSAIEETINKSDIYTFNEKYNEKENKKIVPALIPLELEKTIKIITEKIYKIFNLKGVVRVDYLYIEDKKILYVNEINNIPGSFAYQLFEKEGISFTKLIDDLIIDALLKHSQKEKYQQIYESEIINKQNDIKITK